MAAFNDADLLVLLQNSIKQSIGKPSEIFYCWKIGDFFFWLDELDVPTCYVDGSLKPGASGIQGGGYGVHWACGHDWNKAAPLEATDPLDNNVAELWAALMAIRIAKQIFGFKKVAVYSDSEYVINGITKGVFKWLLNGWKKDNGDPVIGWQLFRELLQEMIDIEVIWVKVKGHSDDVKNVEADWQAGQGTIIHLIEKGVKYIFSKGGEKRTQKKYEVLYSKEAKPVKKPHQPASITTSSNVTTSSIGAVSTNSSNGPVRTNSSMTVNTNSNMSASTTSSNGAVSTTSNLPPVTPIRNCPNKTQLHGTTAMTRSHPISNQPTTQVLQNGSGPINKPFVAAVATLGDSSSQSEQENDLNRVNHYPLIKPKRPLAECEKEKNGEPPAKKREIDADVDDEDPMKMKMSPHEGATQSDTRH